LRRKSTGERIVMNRIDDAEVVVVSPGTIHYKPRPKASWRSGYAEDCKSLHPGSIPGEASRRKLETMRYSDFPQDHFIHRDHKGFIVQRFIDIGPMIPIYRVLTLFGVPLYCWLAREKVPLPPIAGTDEEIEQLRITNAGSFRERLMCNDTDVHELGRRVGEAFPDIPLLGTDILREEKTGRLFVLECNPGGNTWHFSSKQTAGVRRQMGGMGLVGERKAELMGRQMLIDQFGAFARAAELLVRKTRELAS
jgi:hypothetical protein